MSTTEPQCPVCTVDMAPTFYETAMIYSCPDCRGTFMPLDQLQAITNNETQPRSRDEHLEALDRACEKLPLLDHIRAPIPCPWCDEPMERSVFDDSSGIGIDQCAAHGVWLDPGELERAEAWREALRSGLSAQ